jgi:hypothetical protein
MQVTAAPALAGAEFAEHDIVRLDLLSREECAAVRTEVLALREHWRRRDAQLPFFTLGVASYLDAVANYAEYAGALDATNALLSRHFARAYARLIAALSRHFGAPAAFASGLALPGFHIYLAHKMFEQPLASIHCDTQYQPHDWGAFGHADFRHPMSFTLAIALPQCGGGLNTWDMDYAEYSTLTPSQLAQRLAQCQQGYVDYAIGELVLHSGHLVHQAAPARDVRGEDERITLQGHALNCDGQWLLYW